MKWIQTRVNFESSDPESAAAMITDIFCGLGLQGVIVESPDADPELDWADDALPRPGRNAVIGFFRADAQLEENRRQLEDALARLPASVANACSTRYSDVDEQDWAESWKAHFHPVRISQRLVVKPSWRDFQAGGQDIIIELDPGMAFGTGTHPTTALCMRLIERHLPPGARVLDVGTGSGILLVAAAKLGAAQLTGIDCDPVAVDVAEQNLLANRVCEDCFCLRTGDLVADMQGGFDLVVANILTQTILPMIPDIPVLLSGEKIFITSGIIEENQDMIIGGLQQQGFIILEVLSENGWVGIAAKLA
ncbi:MAG: 50S ribosomal protein L11 methyltransferase [Desulfosalsimonas sp.]